MRETFAPDDRLPAFMHDPAFEPEQLPVLSAGAMSLPRLGAARLTADFVRARLGAQPAWEPERTDEPGGVDPLKLREAAILMPLVRRDAGLTVLLTRRNAALSRHAGQISFPGGAREPRDRDAVETALRETREETGIDPGFVEVVGCLPDCITGTGFCVRPVVGLLTPDFILHPDPAEVAEVFEVPLAFLMNPANHEVRALRWEDRTRRLYAMPYRRPDGSDRFIWGATAGMLRNLYHLLAA